MCFVIPREWRIERLGSREIDGKAEG